MGVPIGNSHNPGFFTFRLPHTAWCRHPPLRLRLLNHSAPLFDDMREHCRTFRRY